MQAKISYVKAVLATSYAAINAGVSYTKAVISNVYSGAAERLEKLFSESIDTQETGFLFTQDYVDDTYFEEAGYVAAESRSF